MIVAVAIATLVYLVANLVIGFWRWKSSSTADYVSGGQAFGAGSLTLSFAGTAIGGGMIFVVAQAGFEAGTAILALPISYILGYLLLHLSIPKIRRLLENTNGVSLYDIVDARVATDKAGKSALHVLIAIVNFGMFFFMLAGQFSILATFFEFVLEVNAAIAWGLSLGVIGGSTLVYAVVGGLRKDIATDTIQVISIGCAIIILMFFADRVLDAQWSTIPAAHWTMTGYGIVFPLAVLLFFSPAFIARFDYWQRIIAARDDRSAKLGIWWSLVPISIAYVVFCALGIYARANEPSAEAADAAMVAFEHLLPQWAFVVVLLGVYGAVMSTADTLLNVATVSLYSLVARRGALAAGGPKALARLRGLALVVGLAAGGTVLVAPDAVELIIAGFSSLVILAPSVVALIFHKRPSAKALAWSVGLGYGVFVLGFALLPDLRKSIFVAGFLVALLPVGLWLGSQALLRKGTMNGI